jgi:endonuclease G
VIKRTYLIYSAILALSTMCAFAFIGNRPYLTTNLDEGFEAGGKSSYAAAIVGLKSGEWYMDDALTGSLTTDHKIGTYAARVRNLGSVRMQFDVSTAATFSVQHAVYGADGSSNWELWGSLNGGTTWQKFGATQTASSQTLTTVTFTIGARRPIRFELRRVSGGATDRINFDSISITAITSATPTATSTSTPTFTPTFTLTSTPTNTATNTATATSTATFTPTNTPTPAPGSTTLVLSQIDGGGGGSSGTYLYDYVEIKNISNTVQSLNTLSLFYGAATGNFASSSSNAFALPNVSLNPGQYYLVQLGSMGTAGASLPVTPDTTTSNLNLSASSGKVALVTSGLAINTCGSSATPCNASQLALMVDWVAYGAAGNGAANVGEDGNPSVNNGVALTSSQGAVRKTAGCTDTDNNFLDFDVVAAPVPRNTSTTLAPCSAITPTPTSTVTGTGTPTNTATSTSTATSTPTASPTPVNEHLTMGNPSNAVTNVNQPTNYLMVKPQYVLSYYRDRGEANWVAWHLDTTWLGGAARQDDYRADTSLPSGWYQVDANDYSGSGFDRGHMCPSADRTSTVADNSATFLMTNFVPQAPNNNQGPWEALEGYLRNLVTNSGKELYIYSGGSGQGGSGSNGGTTNTVAAGRVVVPSETWKVIMVLDAASGNDVARVTTSTRLIAVRMPNSQSIGTLPNTNWQTWRVSVDNVEALTGFDFFSNVPTNIQDVIEATVDNQLVFDWENTLDQYQIDEIRAEHEWGLQQDPGSMFDR